MQSFFAKSLKGSECLAQIASKHNLVALNACTAWKATFCGSMGLEREANTRIDFFLSWSRHHADTASRQCGPGTRPPLNLVASVPSPPQHWRKPVRTQPFTTADRPRLRELTQRQGVESSEQVQAMCDAIAAAPYLPRAMKKLEVRSKKPLRGEHIAHQDAQQRIQRLTDDPTWQTWAARVWEHYRLFERVQGRSLPSILRAWQHCAAFLSMRRRIQYTAKIRKRQIL